MQLLQQGKIGKFTTKNKIVMASMTRSRAKNNLVNDLTALYYKQRSSAGLIVSEATQISTKGVGYIDTPGIYSAEQLRAWNKITKTVHDENSLIFSQLWHVGRVSHSSFHNGEAPVSASNIPAIGKTYTYEGMKDFSTPRALEKSEILKIMKEYKQAALNSISAEFDGAELHGANGYLPEQFLITGTNKRNDEYGGTLENRARFMLDAISEMCEAIGSDRVGVKLTPSRQAQNIEDENARETYEYLLTKLNDYNLAYVQLMEPFVPIDSPNIVKNVSEHFRKIYKGTIISNGGFDMDKGNSYLEAGHSDLISYGRPFISNPDLPERFAKGAELNTYDHTKFYGGDETGYTDYPFMK